MIKRLAASSVALGVLAVGSAYAWTVSSVETPDYKSERKDGDFEIRTYPSMVLAQVKRSGTRQSAVGRSFSPLAGYIFAKERPGEKIAMTAPVVQAPSEGGWTVSFILPPSITAQNAPAPTGGVSVVSLPARTMATYRFSGTWSDKRFNDASKRLLAWVADQGLKTDGDVEYGYYNDPFIPAFLRRNEVMVPLRDEGAQAAPT